MGIVCSTYYKWKLQFKDFSEALKKGKEVADFEVENALFKSALGYEVEEETQEFKMGVLVSTKKVRKHISPNPTSMIFWLKNRKPVQWRDKPIDKNDETIQDDGLLEALEKAVKK